MNKPLKILMLEDNETDAEIVQRLLKKEGLQFEFGLAMDEEEFLSALDEFQPDVILADNSLPQFNATAALEITRQRWPNIPFILVTGTVSDEFAANIIKAGADDYILKDRLVRLPAAIDTTLKQRRIEKEKQEALQILIQSEEQYRDLVDNISDLICTHDLDGKVLSVNNAAEKLTGFKFDLQQNINIKDLLTSGIKNGFDDYISGIKKNGFANGVMKIKTRSGDIRTWEYNNSLKTTGVSMPIIRGYARDITESKKAGEALKESEEKYRTIFFKSPLPKWIYDCETLHLLEVNDEAVKHYGYTREAFLNMTINDIRPKEDVELLLNDLGKIQEGINSQHGSLRHLKKNGEIITVETTAHSLDYNNRQARMVVINDITERKRAEADLVGSEEKYRTLVEQAADGIFIADMQGKFITVNPRACNMSQYAEKELMQMTFFDLSIPEDIQRNPFHFEEMQQGKTVTTERLMKRKDGTVVDVETTGKILNDGRMLVFVRDITERKKAEEALKEGEAKYRNVVENIHEALIVEDREGKLVYANTEFYRMFGYSPDKDEILTMRDYTAAASYDEVLERHNNRLKGMNVLEEFEYKGLRKDGTEIWIEARVSTVMENNEIVYTQSLERDITERKKAEEALSANELRFRTLTGNAPVGIFQSDAAGKTVYVNKTWLEYTGLTFNEAMGDGWQEVLHPDDKEKQLKQWQVKSAKGLVSSSEFRLIDKKGNTRWVIGKATPLFNANRQISGYIGTLSDITESKKAEEDLRHSEIILNEAQAIAHISNWEIDLVRNVRTWSDEFYRIYGINKAEVQPSEALFLSFMHPDDADFAQKKVQEAFDTLSDSNFNFRFIRKDGITRHGYTEWKFEFDKDRKPMRIFGILQDITERIEAKENLKLLEQKILEQKIEAQKKIARAILTGQEKERNHIGQELHDNINQILAGTKMYLGIAGKKDAAINEVVKYPMELIDTSIEEIRLLCSKLVTPIKNIDLEELIHALLGNLHQNNATKTDLTYVVPTKLLSDDLKLNIYRILQEQINNIIKYAGAKNVTISIKAHDKSIGIIVTDDGKGFDVNSKRKGIGISNMINRVETFNGNVEIKTNPGNGCKTIVTIPC